MKKLTPMISALIPIIISFVVFDNVIFTNKNLRTNFEKTPISHTYLKFREIFADKLKPLEGKNEKQKPTIIRNIAINWKSSTLLQ
jgi:hypothetical protein